MHENSRCCCFVGGGGGDLVVGVVVVVIVVVLAAAAVAAFIVDENHDVAIVVDNFDFVLTDSCCYCFVAQQTRQSLWRQCSVANTFALACLLSTN